MPAVRAPAGAAAGRVSSGGGAGPLNRVSEHVDPSHSIRYTGRTRERAQRAGEGGDLSEITEAIAAKQAQMIQIQSDIETLQRATTVLHGKRTPAKVTPAQPKAKRKRRKIAAAAKGSPGRPKTTQKRKTTWSAADRKAISRRMKAYWAKRRRARR